jgi:hypothetical protein
MAISLTRSAIQAISSSASPPYRLLGSDTKSEPKSGFEEYYFQLLIFGRTATDPILNSIKPEDLPEDLRDEAFTGRGLEPLKIIYGKYQDLLTLVTKGVEADKPKSVFLPTSGVQVDPDFLEQIMGPAPIVDAKQATLKFLLASRKVSQAISLTWVDSSNSSSEGDENANEGDEKNASEEDEKKIEFDETQIKLVKQIFDFPSISYPSYLLEGNSLAKESEKPVMGHENIMAYLKNKGADEKHLALVINATNPGCSSLPLELLLAGQFYYENAESSKYGVVLPSIFSTFDIAWQYLFSVTWSSFDGATLELNQVGRKQGGEPFVSVHLPYPPKPTEFSLKQTDLKDWASAPEQGGKYPFYPKKVDTVGGEEWTSDEVEYVLPPCPYIPTSSC